MADGEAGDTGGLLLAAQKRIAQLERLLADAEAIVERAWIEKGIASLQEQLGEARKDADRVQWMEQHLCRAGEIKNDAGQTVKLCRVWSIMGELDTLRETVDAAVEAERHG